MAIPSSDIERPLRGRAPEGRDTPNRPPRDGQILTPHGALGEKRPAGLRPDVPTLPRWQHDPVRTLLSERPIARFDTYGTVGHVLEDVRLHSPAVFGPKSEKVFNTVKETLRGYTENEGWNYVVASLTTGMARPELEALLSRKLGNEGPIIIDPNIRTTDHQIFANETEARVHKERLIQANEATSGVMLVLYGLQNPDRNKQSEVVMHHMQRLDATLQFMLEEDARFRSLWDVKELDARLKRQAQLLGLRLQDLQNRMPWLNSNELKSDGAPEVSYNTMHAVLMNALGVRSAEALPMRMLIAQLGIIPSRWNDLGIVDTEALEAAELGRQAEEERARLARGEDLPEEQREKNAFEAARHSEVQAKESREDHAQSARDRSRLLYREARADQLEQEHEAEIHRLQGLIEGARTPQEHEYYTRLLTSAQGAFDRVEIQEETIETRERRAGMRQAEARIGEDGIQESQYAAIPSEKRENRIDQRQRREYALQERRLGERDAREDAESREVIAENYEPLAADVKVAREASQAAAPEEAATRANLTETRQRQPRTTQTEARRQETTREAVQSQTAREAEPDKKETQPRAVRPQTTREETSREETTRQTARSQTTAETDRRETRQQATQSQTARAETERHETRHESVSSQTNQEETPRNPDPPMVRPVQVAGEPAQTAPQTAREFVSEGSRDAPRDATLPQSEQARREDQFGRPPEARGTQTAEARLVQENRLQPDEARFRQTHEDRAIAEEHRHPRDARKPQAEQAKREDQFGRPPEASGTQTPEARLVQEQRLQPDEARFPHTREDRVAAEEARHPARQGELDTPERRVQYLAQEDQKRVEIQHMEDVRHWQGGQVADESRQAQANYSRRVEAENRTQMGEESQRIDSNAGEGRTQGEGEKASPVREAEARRNELLEEENRRRGSFTPAAEPPPPPPAVSQETAPAGPEPKA